MAIGERIRFIRNLRGMTQKCLGTLVGFPEKTADIRMAQYEAGSRTPKYASARDNCLYRAYPTPAATLRAHVPELWSDHTLFALEDRYGLTIETRDGQVVFRIDPRKGKDAARVSEMVYAWVPVAEKYRSGEISKEEYDKWRYNFPQYDDTQIWAKVPSQEFSDAMVKAFKNKLKE